MTSFSIAFEGYWREKNKREIPAQPGVYCVYAAIVKKKLASPVKLIYIGAAADVRARLADHDRQDDWEAHVDTGEELCFSFGAVPAQHLDRCAAALVFRHKPPENTDDASALPFDRTALTLSGRANFLAASFTVEHS